MATKEARARSNEQDAGRDHLCAIDVGASKVACLIVKRDEGDPARLVAVGAGREATRGLKNGVVTDLEALERTLRLALEQAERSAGAQMESAVLTVSGCGLAEAELSAQRPVETETITPALVRETLAEARSTFDRDGATLLHGALRDYQIDGEDGVRDPRGLRAKTIGVRLCAISANAASLENIKECVKRIGLEVEAVAAAPFVAAEQALLEEEREHGVIAIEMGANFTTALLYVDGGLAAFETLPVGGAHVTSDMAHGLQATEAVAERLKLSTVDLSLDAQAASETIDAPKIGDDGRLEAAQVALGDLVSYAGPRVDETLQLLGERLLNRASAKRARRVVLLGGAARLKGLKALTEDVYGLPVRIAGPPKAAGLSDAAVKGGFAASYGALTYRVKAAPDALSLRAKASNDGPDEPGALPKLWRWFIQNV